MCTDVDDGVWVCLSNWRCSRFYKHTPSLCFLHDLECRWRQKNQNGWQFLSHDQSVSNEPVHSKTSDQPVAQAQMKTEHVMMSSGNPPPTRLFLSTAEHLEGSPPPRAATMGDDSEWMKLPVDQKCEHKVAASTLVFVCPCFLSFLTGSREALRLLHSQVCWVWTRAGVPVNPPRSAAGVYQWHL